jgi:hypothetical protein
MADSFDVDLSDFASLSASIGRATAALVAAERAVVEKALLNIKKDTRANISTHPSWSRLASTVSYKTVGLSGVVGYEDRGQGELAGIAEFGSARHAPHPALMPAAKAEAPRFEKATLDVVAQAIEKAL